VKQFQVNNNNNDKENVPPPLVNINIKKRK